MTVKSWNCLLQLICVWQVFIYAAEVLCKTRTIWKVQNPFWLAIYTDFEHVTQCITSAWCIYFYNCSIVVLVFSSDPQTLNAGKQTQFGLQEYLSVNEAFTRDITAKVGNSLHVKSNIVSFITLCRYDKQLKSQKSFKYEMTA